MSTTTVKATQSKTLIRRRPVKLLDVLEVTQYAQLSVESTKIEKKKKALGDTLKLKVRGLWKEEPGVRYICPNGKNVPFLLTLTYQQRSQVQWRDECYALLVEKYEGDEKKAAARLAKIENDTPKKRIPMIPAPKPNPDYDFVAAASHATSAA